MNATFAMLAVAALGIDVGWQPLEEGGVEYIIQIEPDQVDRMVKFDDLISDVPKGLDIRRYRVTIGNDKLPRTTTRAPGGKSDSTKTAAPEADAVEVARPESTGAERDSHTVERVAEGAIPAELNKPKAAPAATVKKTSEVEPQAELDLPDPNAADEAPSLAVDEAEAPTETTAKKPIASTFGERDPQPRDEEEGLATEAAERVMPEPRTITPRRDPLFENTTTRPLQSRVVEESLEEPAPRLPAKSNRYVSEEPEDGYEAQKPPTLPSSFRTAQNTSRSETTDLDRGSDGGVLGPLVMIFFLLLLSIGANMWLGWIAWEARTRYQVLLEKYRSAGGKPVADLV